MKKKNTRATSQYLPFSLLLYIFAALKENRYMYSCSLITIAFISMRIYLLHCYSKPGLIEVFLLVALHRTSNSLIGFEHTIFYIQHFEKVNALCPVS